MQKLTYSEQLRHPNWQRRRLEILESADFACEKCGTHERQLHVHHRRYIKGRMAWDYGDVDLECLCSECHGAEHVARAKLDELLAQGFGRVELALGLLAGAVAMSCDLDIGDEEQIRSMGDEVNRGFVIGAAGAIVASLGSANLANALGQRTDMNPAEVEFFMSIVHEGL